jgi:3-oxoacyl-[acyl-carrier protein] reductase
VLPGMRRARFGDIVTISSLASRNVRVGNSLYGAAKVAVERFSETLAVECARSNIAVNVIAPGFVETEMTAEHLDDRTRRDLLSRIPLRRFTASREIAEAVLMLVARKPLLIGAVVPVGGGGHLMS